MSKYSNYYNDDNDTMRNYFEMPHPSDMNYTSNDSNNSDHKLNTKKFEIIIEHLKSEIKEHEKNSQKMIKTIDSQEQTINQLKKSLKLKENEIQESNNNLNKVKLFCKNLQEKHQITIKNLEQNLMDAHKQEKNLDKSNTENSKPSEYQSNFELNNDIAELNDKLKKYITNLKQGVDVNIEEVKKLLLHYGCSTKITNQKDDRLLIQAVLQRHIIETIFSYAEKYFESSGRHFHLESDIVKSEASLSLLLTHASKCRAGNDEITSVGPTKLRQQIYSILNNCGFADIFGADNAVYEHPFIAYLKGRLNELMNELRIIDNAQKKIESENMAANIIRGVIKIFWFRFKTQEPVVEYLWIQSNAEMDKTYMNGNNNDDDENLYVDLCYFPLIGRDLESNNRKIYTPAKVHIRKHKQQNRGLPRSYESSNYQYNFWS